MIKVIKSKYSQIAPYFHFALTHLHGKGLAYMLYCYCHIGSEKKSEFYGTTVCSTSLYAHQSSRARN